MKYSLRSILTFVLGWPLSLIAIFFLIRSFLSNTDNITINLHDLNWIFILLGIACFMVYFYLRSYSWYLMLRYRDHDLELFESLFQWSFGQLKRYIPGNIWGVVGVSVHFNKKNVSKQNLASSFIIESQLVLLAGSFIALLGIPLIIKVVPLGAWAGLLQSVGVWVVILGSIGYLFSDKIHSFLKLHHFALYLFPKIPFYQLLNLWSLIAVSFVLYGLGTFFVISSTTFLDPTHLWIYIGYFTFSLLVGFLSFITPTGLGVREGVMALGLVSVMPAGIAAFVVLFARVILVIGELLSVAVLYFLDQIQRGRSSSVLSWIRTHPYEIVLVAGYLIFVSYFSFISFLRFENYYTGRFDLGNMEQTVWNTLHGRIFEFTNPNGTTLVSRLAFHADFLLVALTPFYALWQDPRTLLFLQTLITGAGAFFVYRIGLHLKLVKPLAFTIAVLYLLNPSLQRSVIYDFHAVTLATTFLLGAFYALLKKRYFLFTICAVLAGISKEQIWAIIALMGGYMMLFQRKYLLGLMTVILSSLIFYLLIWVVIPGASGTQHFALSYYSGGESASSPTSLLGSFLNSPSKTFALVTDQARLDYLNALFMPLGYLSLFAPLLLVFASPDLAINLLSSKSQLYQIYYQYTAAITPFLFIATIYGISLLISRVKYVTSSMVIMYLVVISLVSTYLYSPLPGTKSPNLDMITRPMPNKATVDSLLNAIPSQYSVSTSNSLGSHLTRRQFLFTMPYGWDSADYIIFMMHETNAYPSIQNHKDQVKVLMNNPAYIKYYDDGEIIAFRKIGLPQ